MESFSPLPLKGKFPLVDVKEPELYRDQFPYVEIPRILFDGHEVPLKPAREIWITDTTFRDGQQARPPYTPEQIAGIYALLGKLGGPKGIIRQCEFFLYSKRDEQALEECLSQNLKFPEVTGWIRADAKDLSIVKGFGLKETGILTSVSDYHVFMKLKSTRAKIMDEYLGIVKAALEAGIRPRCHFEDITRADIYGFCLPLAEKLLRLMEESRTPVKIRLCDTMGFGVTYPGAALPRSVPRIVHAFHTELGYPSECLEWHGHNDFHKVHVNAATAWLHGCSALNATVLGFGERTGNPPVEAAVVEYIGLKGTTDGMDTRVITEIAEYMRTEVQAPIAANYPFVGSEFNVTRAGIHADGIIKNPEIYNIFDTDALLNRPLRVQVTDKSGMAGIAQWINENIPGIMGRAMEPVGKRHPGVRHIAAWVAEQYAQGRTTSISPEELLAQAKHFLPSLFVSDFQKAKEAAILKARHIAERISASPDVHSMDAERMESFLHDVVGREASIQLLAVTNLEGRRISQAHTQRGEKGLFRNLMHKDFRKHDWFVEVLKTRQPYYSDLFFSKYTGKLIMTAAMPIFRVEGAHSGPGGGSAAKPVGVLTDGPASRESGRGEPPAAHGAAASLGGLGFQEMYAVMDIDFRFEELVKLITPIPDEILEVKE
jgi:isopropylmalate/homocitrate/citramalate synthase